MNVSCNLSYVDEMSKGRIDSNIKMMTFKENYLHKSFKPSEGQ